MRIIIMIKRIATTKTCEVPEEVWLWLRLLLSVYLETSSRISCKNSMARKDLFLFALLLSCPCLACFYDSTFVQLISSNDPWTPEGWHHPWRPLLHCRCCRSYSCGWSQDRLWPKGTVLEKCVGRTPHTVAWGNVSWLTAARIRMWNTSTRFTEASSFGAWSSCLKFSCFGSSA